MKKRLMLQNLRERVKRTTGGQTARGRGQRIQQSFPAEAKETIRLAEEALNGLLVLPGTGPDLTFVGSPPRWAVNPTHDNEYIFHLNRMHHWKTMSEAYTLTGDLTYAEQVIHEVCDWIDLNPCPAIDDGQGGKNTDAFGGLSTWRALEAGIRGYRTWPLVVELLCETPCFNETFLEKLLGSVEEHCRVLYEISPLLWPEADHNHYLMENLGLLSFSCLFPEMEHSEAYREHALHELDRCMEHQCTPCGGQIEGCPSYHNGCVFWFAMRLYFSGKYGLETPDSYINRLNGMFRHSVHATRPCGGNFPWGDSHTADKETMSLAAVSCYMAFKDPEYLKIAYYYYPDSTIKADIRDNLWRFSDVEALSRDLADARANPRKPDYPVTAWQKDLDQVYIRSGWEQEAVGLMTGCRTPVQNQHAHIDAGGFDFVAYGYPLISDPGIYTYEDNEHRYHFKSSLWHNCLTINRRDQWEYRTSWSYGPQREGNILSVTESDCAVTVLSTHKNYAPTECRRILALLEHRFLLIIDFVEHLAPKDLVQVNFHLNAEAASWTKQIPAVITRMGGRPNVELITSDSQDEVLLDEGKVSPANDVWHDSLMVRFQNRGGADGCFLHGVLAVPHETGEVLPSAGGLCLTPLTSDSKNMRLCSEGESCGGLDIRFTIHDQWYHYCFFDGRIEKIISERNDL